MRGELQGRVDFIEAGGPASVPGCVAQIRRTNELFTLAVERSGFQPIKVVFCYGPFGDQELTFLAGIPDKAFGIVKPQDAVSIAQRNMADLVRNPAERRRYERFIRSTKSRLPG